MAVGDNIQVTEGSGKRLATGATYTENSQTVRDEKTIFGEPYIATYCASPGSVSVATANDHLFQLMAGSANKVRIRSIEIEQFGLPASASTLGIHLFRLTTAGTGGSPHTPAALDPADAACGATCMTLPTAKGTEAASPTHRFALGLVNAHPVPASNRYFWEQAPNHKPITIAAGTTNGIALKLVANPSAAATVVIRVEFDETPY